MFVFVGRVCLGEVVSRDAIVCDASSLIALADSCFVPLLYLLRKRMSGPFVLSPSVHFECIDRPLNSKQYSLAAVRLKRAERDGVIETVELDVGREVEEILWTANNLFFVRDRPLKLLHEGESEMLALACKLGVSNILVDERTTRMLAEAPLDLKKHLESEFKSRIAVNEKYLRDFQSLTCGMVFFRSCELLAAGFEQGFFSEYGALERQALEAAFYAIKFNGCGVSFQEIQGFLSNLK